MLQRYTANFLYPWFLTNLKLWSNSGRLHQIFPIFMVKMLFSPKFNRSLALTSDTQLLLCTSTDFNNILVVSLFDQLFLYVITFQIKIFSIPSLQTDFNIEKQILPANIVTTRHQTNWFPAKCTNCYVHPMKTQICLHIHGIWSENSMGALWVAKGPRFL